MMKVKSIMATKLVTCTPKTSIREAAGLMKESHRPALPVLEGERLVGIVGQADLLKVEEPLHLPAVFGFLGAAVILDNPLDGIEIEKQLKKILAREVGEVMTKEVLSVEPDDDVKVAVDLMVNRGFALVPVLSGDKLVGTISRADLIGLLAK